MLIRAVCSRVAVWSGFLEEGPGAAANYRTCDRKASHPDGFSVFGEVVFCRLLPCLEPADKASSGFLAGRCGRQPCCTRGPACCLVEPLWCLQPLSRVLGDTRSTGCSPAHAQSSGEDSVWPFGSFPRGSGGVPVVLTAPSLPGDFRDLLASIIGKTILSLHVACV